MRPITIRARSKREYSFLMSLFSRLDLDTRPLTIDEIEDICMSEALRDVDHQDLVSEEEIMSVIKGRDGINIYQKVSPRPALRA
jgi:hypothetical protein